MVDGDAQTSRTETMDTNTQASLVPTTPPPQWYTVYQPSIG